MKTKSQKPQFIISERATPNCKDYKCDIVENPSHWVDVELAEPWKSDLLNVSNCALAELSGLHDPEVQNDHFSADNCATCITIKELKTVLAKASK